MANVSLSRSSGSKATGSLSASKPQGRSGSSGANSSGPAALDLWATEESREITIDSAGRIQYLSSPGINQALAAEGAFSKRRASHVEPSSLPKRLVFRALRIIFGEEGPVSDWTRGWTGSWRVDLRVSGGPVSGPYLFREDAIAAEEKWLLDNRI